MGSYGSPISSKEFASSLNSISIHVLDCLENVLEVVLALCLEMGV
jgi:hypothetical protein